MAYEQLITTSDVVSASKNGIMLSTDKKKLDGLKSYTEVTGTLSAGQTSITLSNSAIAATSYIDIYTTVYGLNPNTVSAAAGSITLTFDTQNEDVGVMIRVM